MLRNACLVAVGVMVTTTMLAAQVPIDSAAGGLRTGQMVRVRTTDGPRLEGRLLAVEHDPVRLRLIGREETIGGASLDSLWVRGNAAKTGAIVGGITLGVGSLALGAAVEAPYSRLTAAALIGAAGGAAVGGLIGAAIPKWRLLYRNAPRFTLQVRPELGLAVSFSL